MVSDNLVLEPRMVGSEDGCVVFSSLCVLPLGASVSISSSVGGRWFVWMESPRGPNVVNPFVSLQYHTSWQYVLVATSQALRLRSWGRAKCHIFPSACVSAAYVIRCSRGEHIGVLRLEFQPPRAYQKCGLT